VWPKIAFNRGKQSTCCCSNKDLRLMTFGIGRDNEMLRNLARLATDESGATAIEYGLIAAATGLSIAAVLPSISSNLEDSFTSIASTIAGN
jgi:pilus assembly protein Flp/PilA